MTPSNRSPCPIATTLEMVGDKWTLVIVRDLLTGKTRYGEFLESPEGISTNILADRLRRLKEEGLVDKRAYQENPIRYEYRLTDRGRGLHPVLQEICRWANHHFPDTWVSPAPFMRRPSD